MKSYLVFKEGPLKPKTKTWFVCDLRGDQLGLISWYGPWRKYVFHPESQTLFDTSCLEEIAGFIKESQENHTEEKKIFKRTNRDVQ